MRAALRARDLPGCTDEEEEEQEDEPIAYRDRGEAGLSTDELAICFSREAGCLWALATAGSDGPERRDVQHGRLARVSSRPALDVMELVRTLATCGETTHRPTPRLDREIPANKAKSSDSTAWIAPRKPPV